MGKDRRQKFIKRKSRKNGPSNSNENPAPKPRFRRRMPPSNCFKKFGTGTGGTPFEFKTLNPKPRENKKSKMYLREEQVGITEFMNEGAGFYGIIKTKFSDYIVNEIDGNGKVCHFSDLSIPIIMEEVADENEQDNDTPPEDEAENPQKWKFPGEYVHFLVYTDYMSTNDLVLKLAENMGINPTEISYCSTKGRHLRNVQKFCIKRRQPSQIANAAKMSEIRVGNFQFKNEKLKLGDTKGNRFKITLRYVRGNMEVMEKSLTNLHDDGFINYFGVLRFGHHQGTPTHKVGVALLKSDYKEVVELIMKPRELDLPFMAKIRNLWWETRDSAAAAAFFKSNDFAEKKLLDALVEHGEDYCAALKMIPRNTLLLYPHAFQSMVFNLIASRRFKEFAKQLLPGDFVYINKDEMDEYIVEHSELPENNLLFDEEPKDMQEGEKAVHESILKGNKVKSLTEEDIASGEYTIYDVVLPLPGYDITYPDNEVGWWYNEILEEHGLSTDYIRDNITSDSLAGSYRKFLMRPAEFTWKFRNYTHPEEHLTASDWDYITGNAAEIEAKKDGESLALMLDFCLPPAGYLTVLLRELLKLDKSAPISSVVINGR